jgi:hypothetical protein
VAAMRHYNGSWNTPGEAYMRYKQTGTLDLLKECDHIVSRALAGKNAIVMIACLVFVAYEGGDAFALDLEDKFGCPLCEEGGVKAPIGGAYWD